MLSETKNKIFPGKPWLDTEGKRIQAHGGSVIFIDGKYYWYGENKEKTTGLDGIWHMGVRCYSSDDLCNWKDEGVIISPDSNPESSLSSYSYVDRPHIIFCKKTGKYVCWLKIMGKDGVQTFTIMQSESFLGPYSLVKEKLKPFGFENGAGDFDLVVDSNGKAYWYFEKVHSDLICAELTDDYTDVSGIYSSHFPHHDGPPFVREAPAHFERNGKHYLFTSGTTAYFPNPSETAVSDNYHGPFTVLGNPHINDSSNTSFHSQISSVFKVPGKKDLYIACADRWLVDDLDVEYDRIRDIFHLNSIGNFAEAAKLSEGLNMSVARNTSVADYVWLPITWNGDKPELHWVDEWSPDDYE